MVAPHLTGAEKRAIDSQRSVMKVYAYKSGLFSVFAHDHEILAPIAAGTVEASENPSVELVVAAAEMQVLEPKVSANDRAEIQKTMVGPEVLDVGRYPESGSNPPPWNAKGRAAGWCGELWSCTGKRGRWRERARDKTVPTRDRPR